MKKNKTKSKKHSSFLYMILFTQWNWNFALFFFPFEYFIAQKTGTVFSTQLYLYSQSSKLRGALIEPVTLNEGTCTVHEAATLDCIASPHKHFVLRLDMTCSCSSNYVDENFNKYTLNMQTWKFVNRWISLCLNCEGMQFK